MPNGDVIDSLSLEIGASVNKSISAIDELQKELGKLNGSLENFKDNGSYKRALENLSKGFADLSQSIEWLDETKINNTAKALNNRAENYAKSLALALELQEQEKALVIAPDDILGMKTLTKDVEKLQTLYEKGYSDAEKIKSFIS